MKDIKRFDKVTALKYNKQISGWNLDEKYKTISHEFNFKDFKGSINFVKKVAKIAEREDHHPDIHIFYNKVLIELSTHSLGGLSAKDFLVASQIDTV